MYDESLRGVSVLVAGAGLAGLVAGHELHQHGADVLIVEARDRVGGRVWTLREGFAANQHAEAGGDLIDEGQTEIRNLAERLGLKLVRILRGGFSVVRRPVGEEPLREHAGDRKAAHPISSGWTTIRRRLEPEIRAYRLAERRWDSAIANALARASVADWLDRVTASDVMRATATAMRGFFLADPHELSLLALVDQFAEDEPPGQGRIYRIEGGNDAIASALAAPLSDQIRMRTAILAITHSFDGVDVSVRSADGQLDRLHADYLICALPASVLRDIQIDPPLPSGQRDAIERLKYGSATKTLLQFERATWRRIGKKRAFGTDLPIGAVWDGNEEQPGPAGILTLLAGGSASLSTAELLSEQGIDGILRALDWLGTTGTQVLASRMIRWEKDPWARGGYAYFDPAYDPALRPWLARPCGHVLFAGEHTSVRWQGYMNGAVESGLRAAAEVRTLHSGLGR